MRLQIAKQSCADPSLLCPLWAHFRTTWWNQTGLKISRCPAVASEICSYGNLTRAWHDTVQEYACFGFSVGSRGAAGKTVSEKRRCVTDCCIVHSGWYAHCCLPVSQKNTWGCRPAQVRQGIVYKKKKKEKLLLWANHQIYLPSLVWPALWFLCQRRRTEKAERCIPPARAGAVPPSRLVYCQWQHDKAAV